MVFAKRKPASNNVGLARTLSRQAFLTILLISVAAFLVSFGVEIFQREQKFQAQFSEQLDRMEADIARQVWYLQNDSIRTTFDWLSVLSEVRWAHIDAGFMTYTAPAGTVPEEEGCGVVLTRDLSNRVINEREVGKAIFSVCLMPSYANFSLIDFLANRLAFQIVVLVAAIAVFHSFSNRLVLTPISNLSEAVSRGLEEISFGEIARIGKRKDEIGHLSRVFEEASSRVLTEKEIAQNLLSATGLGMVIIDETGVIGRAGPNLRTLLGIKTDLLGKPIEFIDDSLKSVKIDDVKTLTLADRRVIEVTATPVHFGQDRGPSRAVFFRDVTQAHQEQLQQLQSEKTRALGTLAGGIAHDFNNALAIIVGSLNLLETSLKEKDEVDLLEAAQTAASRSEELTSNLLKFVRKEQLAYSKVSASEALNSVGKIASHTIDRAIELKFDIQTDAQVITDRSLLESALLNLIINAKDAIPEKGVIRVGAADTTSKNGTEMVELYVEDTGNGIPKDLIEQVTDPFFTTKEPGKGTGLGLAMVSDLMQKSDGSLEIESIEGKGTRISMRYPVSGRDAKKVAGGKASNLDKSFEGARLVFLDDELLVARTFEHMARYLNCETNVYNTYEALLEGTENFEYIDILFCDLQMPTMSGIEVIADIRERGAAFPIVLLSGNIPAEVRAKASKFEGISFIEKPCSLDKLRNAISRNFSRNSNLQTPAA